MEQATKTRVVTGQPTQPDVDRMLEHFGVPAEGTVITWAEIEAVIREPRNGNRWQTVLAAWRQTLEDEHGVWMRTIRGVGVEAADPRGRLHQSSTWANSGVRSICRASALAAKTDRRRLSEPEQKALDQQRNMAAAMARANWFAGGSAKIKE